MAIPPPPEALPAPPRMVRSLRVGLLFTIVICIVAGIALITWWSLHSIGASQEAKADQKPGPTSQGPSLTDFLANAPQGTEIPRAGIKVADRPQPKPQPEPRKEDPKPQPQPQAQAPIDDNMTDAAIAARRAAWTAYYQQLADIQKAKAERAKAGMAADIFPQKEQNTSQDAPGTTTAGQPKKDQPNDLFSAVASNPATDYSPFTLTDPISPYEVKAGDILTAKLLSGLNSDSTGDVLALVTKPVYDHATGNHILIPQGSHLFGSYAVGGAYGQTRVMVAWTRVIYPPPCDQSLDLGAMAGADQTGQAGFSDITDDHKWKIFFNGLMLSLFSAGIQLSQPPGSSFQQYSPIQSAGGAVGQQMSQLGMEFARRGMDIPPTQRIRQGYPFVVMMHKDIAFEAPWQPGVCKTPSVQVASR